MKKLIILSLALFIPMSAQALTYVNEVILLDGSHVRQCKLENGFIDYCTEEDALNAQRAMQNPRILLYQQIERPTFNSTLQSINATAQTISNTIYSIRGISNALGRYW